MQPQEFRHIQVSTRYCFDCLQPVAGTGTHWGKLPASVVQTQLGSARQSCETDPVLCCSLLLVAIIKKKNSAKVVV